jgi:septal ring factor EnvC (AmiA/AmiB activator)
VVPAAALVACVATVAGAAKHHKRDVAPTPAPTPAPAVDSSAPIAEQLTAESASIAQAVTTVHGKLAALDATRGDRLRDVARLLHQPLPAEASADDRMAFARRRAAVRLLAQRDASEHALLADELMRLRDAAARVSEEATRVAQLPTIDPLLWPARGTVVRGFGPFTHDATHAVLSRRGIDLEVDSRADVVAPADGIVSYAGPIRGLDHGVVIDHGGYFTVLAKLGDSLPPGGTHVTRGQQLGRAAHHRVYLEVRVKLGPGGLPVDPQPLLAL